MELERTIALVLIGVVVALIICGMWAHWKIIRIDFERNKLMEQGVRHGREYRYVKMRVKRLGIFKNYWSVYHKFFRFKTKERDYIEKYQKYT